MTRYHKVQADCYPKCYPTAEPLGERLERMRGPRKLGL